jgi:hypothetical protein
MTKYDEDAQRLKLLRPVAHCSFVEVLATQPMMLQVQMLVSGKNNQLL